MTPARPGILSLPCAVCNVLLGAGGYFFTVHPTPKNRPVAVRVAHLTFDMITRPACHPDFDADFYERSLQDGIFLSSAGN